MACFTMEQALFLVRQATRRWPTCGPGHGPMRPGSPGSIAGMVCRLSGVEGSMCTKCGTRSHVSG